MTIRQITESDAVQKIRDKAYTGYTRSEDAWDGITWLVARKPEVGTLILGKPELRFHKQLGYVHTKLPAISILYTYDNVQVNIIAVKFEIEEGEEEVVTHGEKTRVQT